MTTTADATAPAVDAPVATGPRWTPERTFVVLALVLGLAFAIATPAFGGYDENIHFLRAWSISNGHLVATPQRLNGTIVGLGDRFPSALFADMVTLQRLGAYGVGHAGNVFHHLGDTPPKAHPTRYIDFRTAAVYAPLPYLPTVVAIRAGRLAHASLLVILLVARVAQLLAYILLVVWALRRAPRLRWLLAALALAPVALFQAAMISGDGVTIALTLLCIAIAAACATATPPSRRLVVEAAIVVVALGLAKPPYVLFVLLFVPAIVRHWRRASAASSGRWLLAALAPGVVAGALWDRYAQHVYVAPNYPFLFPGSGYAYHDVDTHRQLRHIAHQPFEFVATVGRTLAHTWARMLHDTVAQIVVWHKPLWVDVVIAVVVLAAVGAVVRLGPRAGGAPDAARAPWERAIGLAVAAIGAVAVFVLAYTGWNAVGAPRIDAFQGRYLFPLFAVAVYAAAPTTLARVTPARARVGLAASFAALAAISIVAGTTVVSYYY